MEKWKDIPGYEGLYQVSDKGNVKSLDRFVKRSDGVIRKLKSKQLTKRNSNGYATVALYKGKIRKEYKISQLVAMVFLGHSPNWINLVVDHIDNNQSNDCLENLQIISNRENCSKDKRSSSGHRNIYHYKDSFFKVIIFFNRKGYYFGYYDTIEDAIKVRDLIEENRHLFKGCAHTFREQLGIEMVNMTTPRFR